MGVTSNYGLPYAEGSDSPNGAVQEKALADATDAALTTVASTAATNLSAGLAPVVAKVGRLFGARLASNQGVTSLADLTGVSVTFTTAAPNTLCQITATLDAQTTGGNYCEGVINIDGTDQPWKCHAESDGIGGPDTGGQCVTFTIPSTGSHTIKMRAVQSGGSTTAQAQSTGISVLVLGP